MEFPFNPLLRSHSLVSEKDEDDRAFGRKRSRDRDAGREVHSSWMCGSQKCRSELMPFCS